MKLSKEEIANFVEEIQELTELLNTEWADLREMLSEEINLESSLLCGYMEDEEGGEYGAILTKDKQIYDFSIQDGDLRVTKINDVKDIEEHYPQVFVALNHL